MLFALMSQEMDILAVLAGVVSILVAIVGRSFQSTDSAGGGFRSEKDLPLWLGRLLFGGVGTIFLVLGVVSLLSR